MIDGSIAEVRDMSARPRRPGQTVAFIEIGNVKVPISKITYFSTNRADSANHGTDPRFLILQGLGRRPTQSDNCNSIPAPLEHERSYTTAAAATS